jgi:hypothetical protein
MPPRSQVNTSINALIQPQVTTANHREANKQILDYIDQEIAAFKVTVVNTVESGSMSAVTSGAVAAALTGKANTADLASKADLVGGKLPVSQLPTIDVGEFMGKVSNQAAMTAVTAARKSDWVNRLDNGKIYVLTTDDPTVAGNWVDLAYPAVTIPVESFNGRTGAIVPDAADYATHYVAKIAPKTPATHAVVTYNEQGQIVGGRNLEAADVPQLPTSKITNLDTELAGKATPASVTTAIADAVAVLKSQIDGGVPEEGNTLDKLYDFYQALNALVTGTTPDGDSTVSTVQEVLAVMAAYPEGMDILEMFAGKVSVTSISSSFTETDPTKVMSATAAKALYDLLQSLIADFNQHDHDLEYALITHNHDTEYYSQSLTDLKFADKVGNNTDTFTSTAKVTQMVTLTQSQFDALATKDANTLYIVPIV